MNFRFALDGPSEAGRGKLNFADAVCGLQRDVSADVTP
jgi:hypothetical protein